MTTPVSLALGEDVVHAMAGTVLDSDRSGCAPVVRMTEGAALFDVRTIGFTVAVPDGTVRVRGTVFTVVVASGLSRVDVYEGTVEVSSRDEVVVLTAGERFGGNRHAVPDALVLQGRLAARERARSAREDRPQLSEPASAGVEGFQHRSSGPASPRDRGVEESVLLAGPVERRSVASPTTPTAPTTLREPRVEPPSLEAVRALLEAGRHQDARDAILRARPTDDAQGEWALLEGDAERGLRAADRAAAAYERAATHFPPTRAAVAGYLAAVQFAAAGAPVEALAAIERWHVAERGAPLEERGVALRATLLARTGRDREARTSARAYLLAFPSGEARARMQRLLEEASVSD
ncbi:MAG: FecR domain-containing protein [Myxococcales bacterium]|nr:FecR domain-containing protein [Myxococcales bacterium]